MAVLENGQENLLPRTKNIWRYPSNEDNKINALLLAHQLKNNYLP